MYVEKQAPPLDSRASLKEETQRNACNASLRRSLEGTQSVCSESENPFELWSQKSQSEKANKRKATVGNSSRHFTVKSAKGLGSFLT
jgi:hypothetical protein